MTGGLSLNTNGHQQLVMSGEILLELASPNDGNV